MNMDTIYRITYANEYDWCYMINTVRPLTVEILFNNQPLSADRRYEIECQAIGSRPPAKISWWLGDIELPNHFPKVWILFSCCRC